MITALLIDTETTGLTSPQPCQIGYIGLQHDLYSYEGSELTRLDSHTLFRQNYRVDKPIEPGAFKVHGISRESLVTCPHYKTFRLPNHKYFVAFNASYDIRALELQGADISVICMMKVAKHFFPNRKSYKLADLISDIYPTLANKILSGAHDALTDCKFMLALLANLQEEFEISSFDQLFEIAGSKPTALAIPSVMPFGKYKGWKFEDIPLDYLQWLENQNLQKGVATAVRNALKGSGF